MKQCFAWMALVFAFGASGRSLGLDNDFYELHEEPVAVSCDQYEAVID